MKNFKNIIVTFFTAIITIFLLYGGYTIYAQDSDDEEYDYYSFVDLTGQTSLFIIKGEYHFSMNLFFNHKMERLVNLIDSNKDFYNHKDFLVPDDVTLKNYETKCGKTNVSTYCVSMEALDIYIKYLETLNALKSSLPTEEIGQFLVIPTLVEHVQYRDKDIELEAEQAKEAMEATIAAYDEFKSAYPMHKKYEQIINNLSKYRIELRKIRAKVTNFPLRFVDSTSSECE